MTMVTLRSAKSQRAKTPPVMLPNSDTFPGADGELTRSTEAPTQYLLVCQAKATTLTEGTWSFTLETADGVPVFDAHDSDMGDLNRLTLLAAVRGLEAIDGPSSVMLLSSNRYMIRSLTESLPRWRENRFVWEHFGRRIDVQHADLWRRIDRALQIHRVEACLIASRRVSDGKLGQSNAADSDQPWVRVDSPHLSVRPPRSSANNQTKPRDGLRRWLLAGGASQSSAPPKRRFTSRDWLESA